MKVVMEGVEWGVEVSRLVVDHRASIERRVFVLRVCSLARLGRASLPWFGHACLPVGLVSRRVCPDLHLYLGLSGLCPKNIGFFRGFF